jgi:hypothetical protein
MHDEHGPAGPTQVAMGYHPPDSPYASSTAYYAPQPAPTQVAPPAPPATVQTTAAGAAEQPAAVAEAHTDPAITQASYTVEQPPAATPENAAPAAVPAGATEGAEVPLQTAPEAQPVAPAAAPQIEEAAGPAVPAEPLSPFPRSEGTPRRKSYVDLTAAPCFGHAADYTWLRGQAEYSRISKGWRLRYASVDEVDRYGGSVTLVENKESGRLKDGQYVAVRGHISSTGEEGAAASYWVESFEVITDPNAVYPPGGPK